MRFSSISRTRGDSQPSVNTMSSKDVPGGGPAERDRSPSTSRDVASARLGLSLNSGFSAFDTAGLARSHCLFLLLVFKFLT